MEDVAHLATSFSFTLIGLKLKYFSCLAQKIAVIYLSSIIKGGF